GRRCLELRPDRSRRSLLVHIREHRDQRLFLPAAPLHGGRYHGAIGHIGPALALPRRGSPQPAALDSSEECKMKTRMFGALLAPVLAFGLAACTVDQTEEGEMPDVDVEAGQLPQYDVQPADVDVNWDTTTVRT